WKADRRAGRALRPRSRAARHDDFASRELDSPTGYPRVNFFEPIELLPSPRRVPASPRLRVCLFPPGKENAPLHSSKPSSRLAAFSYRSPSSHAFRARRKSDESHGKSAPPSGATESETRRRVEDLFR